MKINKFGIPLDAARRLLASFLERPSLKLVAMHVPFESQLWFVYHYLVRFGLLEGRAGLIASRIRAHHFFQVRAKLFELRKESGKRSVSTRAVAPALQGQARSRSAH